MPIRELSPDARALALTDAIYEAALAPEQWDTALGLLKDALGGSAVSLRVESFGSGSIRHHWLGFEPAFLRAYADHYYRDDVCAASWPVGKAATADALVPPDVRRRAPFFHELCVPFRLDDMVGGLLESTPHGSVALSVLKPRGRTPFNGTHASLLDRLLPHLRRAVRINTELGRAEAERAQHWEVWEQLAVGVFLVGEDGKLKRANRAAERLLGHGLQVGRDGLRAETAPASRALHLYLATLREPERQTRNTPPGVALVRSDGTPLFALAVPSSLRSALPSAPGDVLLLVTDPTTRVEPPLELLTRAFGLTRAESRVALAIGRGSSPKEAAEELGVAWNTVRSQLREVYAKTHTRGQAGLVRCLALLGVASQQQE